MSLAKRLGKVEATAAHLRAAREKRERAPEEERQQELFMKVAFLPGMPEAIEAICGFGSYRGQVRVIADEHEIEVALDKFSTAYRATALEMGWEALAELEPESDPPRRAFLPWDETPFHRAVNRFAAISPANHALALRYCNAVRMRHGPGDGPRVELEAAVAVFVPRFEAFRAEEEKQTRRRERRRAGREERA